MCFSSSDCSLFPRCALECFFMFHVLFYCWQLSPDDNLGCVFLLDVVIVVDVVAVVVDIWKYLLVDFAQAG